MTDLVYLPMSVFDKRDEVKQEWMTVRASLEKTAVCFG